MVCDVRVLTLWLLIYSDSNDNSLRMFCIITSKQPHQPQSTTAGRWRGTGIPQTPFKNCSILGVFCVRRNFLNLWNAVNEILLLIWAFLLNRLMSYMRFFLLFLHKTSCSLRDDHQSHMLIAGKNGLRVENGQQNKNKHPSPDLWPSHLVLCYMVLQVL